jgi:3'(2'), 5'-bisphosphate nucleotidase
MDITRTLLNDVIELSVQAGEAILDVYNSDRGFNTVEKADSSPVTDADHAAHNLLLPALSQIEPNVPVLSEESNLPDFEARASWGTYWIIDPLDGTKEFIKRNGEFTVNIALIKNNVPVLGVVHVPVVGITYAGADGLGAMRIDAAGETLISTRRVSPSSDKPLTVVASRSHGSEAVENCMENLGKVFPDIHRHSMGSSLKLCLVAAGEADLYPRLAPTSEWDTAAAQAVVEAAGGVVLDADLAPLRYNTKADILNPWFYVIGDPSFDWPSVLSSN